MTKYIFGVDIGGTTCKIGFFEAGGKLLNKWEIPTHRANNGARVLDDLAATLREKLASVGLSTADLLGIGLGIPGLVAPNGMVSICANLGWRDLWVEKDFSALMDGLPVKALKDSNAAALGEIWQGTAKDHKSLAFVTIGTGIGGGIVLDGKLVIGTRGAGAEIGHIVINPKETRVCGCGNKGCVEQYASATAMVRRAEELLSEDYDEPSILDGLEKLTTKEIFEAYSQQDRVATQVVEEFGECLGRGLSMASSIVDPEIFLIGGGVSKAGQVLLDVVQKYFREYAIIDCKTTEFAIASLGNDAGIYGAAKLILDEVQ